MSPSSDTLTQTARLAANGSSAAPKRIGKFAVVRELGQGGMSTVYLARDPMLERMVAVKTIRLPKGADQATERQFLGRFIREARAIAGLDHPNVVRFYEIGEDQGLHYIAMEYLDGGSMNDLVQAREPLPLGTRLDTLLQICEGVAAIHEAGMIHSDLKPHNIMLTAHGQAKIMDFGAARPMEADMVRTTPILGTPRYMSPEQLRNQHMDHRSDIFSLGALCYELITYEKAFPGDSMAAVTQMITSAEPPAAITSNPLLPPGMDAVIMKAMAKRPSDRYFSCLEMAADIRDISAMQIANEQAEARFPARTFAAGSLIFAQGDPGHDAYLLKKGQVRIFKESGGKELDLAVVAPVSLFGEMALLLKEGLRTASAAAIDEVTVLEVNRRDFQELMRQSPRAIQAVLRVLVQRLKDQTEKWCAEGREIPARANDAEDPLD